MKPQSGDRVKPGAASALGYGTKKLMIGPGGQRREGIFFKKIGVPRKKMTLFDGPPSSSVEVQNELLAESHHEGHEDREDGFRPPFQFNNTRLKDRSKPFDL